MQILTLNSNVRGVGTYQRCFYFSRELARSGHEVTMVTVSPAEKYRPLRYYKREWVGGRSRPEGEGPWVRMIEGPNLGYKWLPGWGSGPLDIACRLGQIFRNYDAVYGFEYQPDVSWPVYASLPWRRYCFLSDWCDWYAGSSNHLRGCRLLHRLDACLENAIRRLARKVSVISPVLAERARGLGLVEEQVELIPQGVDLEYCRPVDQVEARRLLAAPADRPTLVSTNDGDMKRSVRIFAHLQRRCRDAYWIAVGQPQPEAQTLAQKLGLSRSIRWAGRVSDEDYPLYVSCADACFLPLADDLNNRARFPAKVLDFLACARPLITNDVGEVGPILRHHQVGALASQPEEEFAEQAAILLQDRDLCRTLGGNARVLMERNYDWRRRGPQINRMLGLESPGLSCA